MAVIAPRLRGALALVLTVALLSPGRSAFADKPAPSEAQKAEARARYERGLKLYDQGAYEAALVEMRRAYELSPSFKILYNLGLIHRQLNDHAAALEAFRGYLAEGAKKIDAKRQAEVEKAIKELEPLVATVTVQVDVDGAEVSVDDAPIGTSPLTAPIVLNAGKRRIAAKLPGKAAAVRVVTVAGSDTLTVKLELADPKAAAPVATAETKKPEPPPKPPAEKHDVPWLAWGITGAFAASAAVTGVVALTSASSLRDQRDTPNASRDDLDAASSRTKTWALVTDVLLVGTVVSAGVSTWLTFRTPSTKDTATTTVRIGLSPTGFSLGGAF